MKDYPYFKFYVNEWISGDISFLDFEEQGLFINLCCYYWSRNGNLSLANAKRKFTEVKPTAFDSLIENEILKLTEDEYIKINFLDEQMGERGIISLKNSENGKKGGRPKKPIESETKPTAFFSESETKAKKSNKEEKREEEKRREKKEEKKSDFDLLFDRWFNYKSDRKEKYKSEDSMDTFKKSLLKLSNSNIEIATKIIEQSIANNWAGIFELKNSVPVKKQSGGMVRQNFYADTI